MPNLRGKTWTPTTPANVEDAQYWEDHLISDEDAAKIGTVILPAGGTAGQVLTKQSGNPNDADWDDPASSGHTIEDEDGVVMPYQSTLQFVSAEVTNDSTNNRTVVDCKGAKGDAATVDAGTVITLPAGSPATVVNSGTTSDAVFDFGIPRGADGIDGTDGEDGFSPAVTITTIPGGHRINITDEAHPQGQDFDVMDGSGSGDMQASAYDPNSDVYNAGGIPDYVDDEITTAISGKADKVTNATNGNFAGLDASGNLTNSGKKASDFLPSNTPIPDAVTANPQGTATGTLTKLGIGSDIYDIQGSGGADKADISAIGTNETGATASKAYAIGEHFYKNSKFCTAKAAIAQGAQFTLGTNYVEGTIADVIKYQEYIFDGDTSSYQYHVRAYRQGRIGFYDLRLYCYPAASLPAGTVIDFGVIPEGLRCKNAPYAAAFSPDGKKSAHVVVYMDYSGATNNITMTLKDEVTLYGQMNAYIPVIFQ